MRKRFRYPVAALLLVLLSVLIHPAVHAQTAPPVLVSLAVPPIVKAGDTLRITALTRVPPGGATVGYLALRGPHNQTLGGYLIRQPGTDNLVLELPLSPYTEPGTWKVSGLQIHGGDNAPDLSLAYGDAYNDYTFQYTFQVRNTGAADLAPALVQDFALSPGQVEAGGALTLSARVAAPSSGINRVVAFISLAPGDTKPEDNDQVILRYNPQTDRWEGTTAVRIPPANQPSAQMWVRRLYTWSNAGVRTVYGCAPDPNPLPGACMFTIVPANLIPQLRTSPAIDLFYPGSPDFFGWAEQDAAFVRSLYKRLEANPMGVRERLAAQLPALQAALASIRAEVYTDPDIQVRIATPNTSGKFLALAAAARGRILLWAELDRREGLSAGAPLTAEMLETKLALSPLMSTTPATAEIYAGPGAVLTQRILEQIKTSRMPVPVWLKPSMQDANQPMDMSLMGSVIWVIPFHSKEAEGWVHPWDREAGIVIALPRQLPLVNWATTVIHELGHVFHDVYLGGVTGDRSEQWSEYLTLRGGQIWYDADEIDHDGRPWENFAEDFAKAFAPAVLAPQISSVYMYPPLQDDPQRLEKFRQFVRDLTKSPTQTPLTLNWPLDALVAAPPGSLKLTGGWIPGNAVTLQQGPVLPSHFDGSMASLFSSARATSGADGRWELTVTDGRSPLQLVLVSGWGGSDRVLYIRRLFLYRSPLRLDALPVYTEGTSLTVTGSAAPDATVMVGNQPAVVDTAGHFQATVVLRQGINQVRVSVVQPDGATASAVGEVTAGTPAVPLVVDAPPGSDGTSVTLVGSTEPGSTVTAEGNTVVAADDGTFQLSLALQPGANPVAVTVQSGSRKVSWYGTITGAAKPLSVEATVPSVTDSSSVTLSGRTSSGSSLTLNGTPVQLQSGGDFQTDVHLKPGDNALELIVTGAWGQRRTWKQTVRRRHEIKLILGETTGYVDGEERPIPVPPQIMDDSTYVPLRFLGEALGATVEWDPDTRTVTFALKGEVVRLTVDSTVAYVNGQPVQLSTPPRIVAGSTLVPVRFVGKNLDASVSWNSESRTVTLLR